MVDRESAKVQGGLCNNLTLGLRTMRKRQKIDATNKVEAARLKEEICRKQYRTETG